MKQMFGQLDVLREYVFVDVEEQKKSSTYEIIFLIQSLALTRNNEKLCLIELF
jgi:hypothetical protein